MRQNFNIFASFCQGKLTVEQQSVVLSFLENGRGSWIRTNGCRYQKPVPYHLAIPLMRQNFNIFASFCQGKLTVEQQSVVLSFLENGRGSWIRTNGCRYQKPVPYHLAIPLNLITVKWQG